MVAKKKGDVILSWVLLVGFVIGLATIVGIWIKERAEDQTGQVISQKEQEIRCAQTSINGKRDCAASPPTITITNKGVFTIQALKLRQETATLDEPITIKPTETQPLNTNLNTAEPVDVIPVININGKEVPCATRKITLPKC